MQNLFDKERVLSNHKNAGGCDFLFKWCADEINARINIVKRDFPTAFVTDNRTNINNSKIGKFTHGGNADLVISPLCLHTKNDLVAELSNIRSSINSGGMLISAIPSSGTLRTLRQVFFDIEGESSIRIAPFPDASQVMGLLGRCGFALPVVDVSKVWVDYPDIFKLFSDLKMMGERNPMVEISPASSGLFKKAQNLYPKNKNGRIDVLFEIMFCVGWAGLK